MSGSLPAQRTELAWSRTSLATLGLALVVARVAADAGAAPLALAVIATVGAAAFVAVARHRARQLRSDATPDPVRPTVLALVAAAVVVADLAGLALVLS